MTPRTIVLNPGILDGGYSANSFGIPADTRSLTMPLSAFEDGDERFDPARKAVTKVLVTCIDRPRDDPVKGIRRSRTLRVGSPVYWATPYCH
jgi:hypothetical protein